MRQLLLAVALFGYVSAAKLDHLEYLPPHNRPTPSHGNQEAGLEAPGVQANIKSGPAAPSLGNNGFGQPSQPFGDSQPSTQQFGGHPKPQQPSGSYQQPSGSYQQPSESFGSQPSNQQFGGHSNPQQPSGSYQQPSGLFGHTQQPSGSYQQGFSQPQPSAKQQAAPSAFGHSQTQHSSPKFNSFAQPQPSTSFNQKTPFGVESDDDTVSIDAPIVEGSQGSFGLPNPGRQYLAPFGNKPANQQKPSSFGSFSGPAKLDSIFGNQKPSYQAPQAHKQPSFNAQPQKPSHSQQYEAPKPHGTSPSVFGSHQPSHHGQYQAPAPQNTNQGPFQPSHGVSQPTNYQAPSHHAEPSYNAAAPENHHQSSHQASKLDHDQQSGHRFQPFGKSGSANQPSTQYSQNSAPYKYNKPTPSFSTPSFGGNNAPHGSQQPGTHNQGSSFPQSNYKAPSISAFPGPSAYTQSHGSDSGVPSAGPQQAPQKSNGQYPVQAQDENGAYIY